MHRHLHITYKIFINDTVPNIKSLTPYGNPNIEFNRIFREGAYLPF